MAEDAMMQNLFSNRNFITLAEKDPSFKDKYNKVELTKPEKVAKKMDLKSLTKLLK